MDVTESTATNQQRKAAWEAQKQAWDKAYLVELDAARARRKPKLTDYIIVCVVFGFPLLLVLLDFLT